MQLMKLLTMHLNEEDVHFLILLERIVAETMNASEVQRVEDLQQVMTPDLVSAGGALRTFSRSFIIIIGIGILW